MYVVLLFVSKSVVFVSGYFKKKKAMISIIVNLPEPAIYLSVRIQIMFLCNKRLTNFSNGKEQTYYRNVTIHNLKANIKIASGLGLICTYAKYAPEYICVRMPKAYPVQAWSMSTGLK